MEAIGRCCRNIYVQPFDRQKAIYICGAVGGVLLVILVVVTISWMTPSSESVSPKGSDALKNAPLVVGYNYLPQNLKSILKNKISSFTFTEDWNKTLSSCGTCQTDYPKLKAGKVAVQVWSAQVDCAAQYHDAVTQTIEQIDVIRRFITLNLKSLSFHTSLKGLKEGFSKNPEVISSIISVNGGHSIEGRLGVLRMFYQLGVRVMSIASSTCDSAWAVSDSTTNDTGLTDFGKLVVAEMNRLGIVIDLTGASYKTQLAVLDASTPPVIFSHSAAYNKSKGSKNNNIKDEVLAKLKEKKGLLMVTFTADISNNGTNITTENVIEHIDYLKTALGADGVGIGGAYDVDAKYPTGLEDISKIGTLFDTLYSNSKWSLPELEGLAGKNFLRVLESVESFRDTLATKTADETWEPSPEALAPFNNKEYNNTPPCYTDFKIRYNYSSGTV